MRAIKLYATGSATGNAVASITNPTRGTLVGVQAAIKFDSITDGASVNLELSKAAASRIAINGNQDSIAEFAWFGNFVTSGLSQGGVNLFVPVSFAIEQGAFIYLHASVSGTVTYDATFILSFR